MRTRTVLAVPTAVAALALTTPQSWAAPSAAVCPEKAVVVSAAATADPTVIHLGVTNRSARHCAVDRFPTVVFGDLDGPAVPVPPAESASYRLGPGRTAYAALRTVVDPADPRVRRVGTVGVAAAPSHHGRTFTAREIGAGDAVLVWEPVTTWWQPSAAAADEALADAAG
ncbi:DUF4232 domain-containing protein [Streptomyces sp. NPDC008313]|uniref:DUF4232 domain-containing protein n=1 Tax=Streptomyces sp. NPDC008313 TaxID=3364826 RepID=UPI0036E710A0